MILPQKIGFRSVFDPKNPLTVILPSTGAQFLPQKNPKNPKNRQKTRFPESVKQRENTFIKSPPEEMQGPVDGWGVPGQSGSPVGV